MDTLERLSPSALQARWLALTEDDDLAEFEGRTEIDADGEIVLTPPPSLEHQITANEIAEQLKAQLGGRAVVECPVLVDGVLIADVAWFREASLEERLAPAAERPDIVVEVASPRNTRAGLRRKSRRYLDHGATEVILVELDGTMRFLTEAGEASASRFGVQLAISRRR